MRAGGVSVFLLLLFITIINGSNIHEKLIEYYDSHPLSEEVSFLAILKVSLFKVIKYYQY